MSSGWARTFTRAGFNTRSHARAGTVDGTLVLVTHDREMVDKMRKRVIQLEEGRLARDERRGGYTGE